MGIVRRSCAAHVRGGLVWHAVGYPVGAGRIADHCQRPHQHRVLLRVSHRLKVRAQRAHAGRTHSCVFSVGIAPGSSGSGYWVDVICLGLGVVAIGHGPLHGRAVCRRRVVAQRPGRQRESWPIAGDLQRGRHRGVRYGSGVSVRVRCASHDRVRSREHGGFVGCCSGGVVGTGDRSHPG